MWTDASTFGRRAEPLAGGGGVGGVRESPDGSQAAETRDAPPRPRPPFTRQARFSLLALALAPAPLL